MEKYTNSDKYKLADTLSSAVMQLFTELDPQSKNYKQILQILGLEHTIVDFLLQRTSWQLAMNKSEDYFSDHFVKMQYIKPRDNSLEDQQQVLACDVDFIGHLATLDTVTGLQDVTPVDIHLHAQLEVESQLPNLLRISGAMQSNGEAIGFVEIHFFSPDKPTSLFCPPEHRNQINQTFINDDNSVYLVSTCPHSGLSVKRKYTYIAELPVLGNRCQIWVNSSESCWPYNQ